MAEVFLATAARGAFRISFMGVGPTEMRLVLAGGALALMPDPDVVIGSLGPFGLFDVGGGVALVGLAARFAASAAGNGRALHAEETIPRPRDARPTARCDRAARRARARE